MTGITCVRLRDVVRLNCRPVPVDPDITYQSVGILNRGRGLFSRGPLSGAETSYKTLYSISEDDLIYSKLFAWEGAVTVVQREYEGAVVSSEFPTFVVDRDRVDISYLRALTSWHEFHALLARVTTGLGQRRQRVNVDSFLDLEIPLPALGKQREVINIHECSLFAGVSRRALDSLTLCGPSVSRLVMLDDYCDAELFSLGELMQLRRTPVKVDAAERYVEIGIRSFGRGVFRKPSISGGEILTKRVFKIQCSDLLLSNLFSWEGAISVANEAVDNCIGSHRFLTYVPRLESVEPNYLRAYLLSDQGLAKIRAASPGSAGRNRTLNINLLENVRVPLPPVRIQRQVAERFTALQRLVELREKRRRLAEALPQSVLNDELGEL